MACLSAVHDLVARDEELISSSSECASDDRETVVQERELLALLAVEGSSDPHVYGVVRSEIEPHVVIEDPGSDRTSLVRQQLQGFRARQQPDVSLAHALGGGDRLPLREVDSAESPTSESLLRRS